MTLTDDQLRSLREKAEASVGTHWSSPAAEELAAYVKTNPLVLVALVEEVERLRHTHVTDPEGTSHCPLAESLQREVDRLREHVTMLERLTHYDALGEQRAMFGDLLSNYTRLEAERDALAAKAEAGKGLYEALRAICEDLGTFRPEFEPDAEERAALAALARWEAANG